MVKKLITLAVALALLFTFVACGSPEEIKMGIFYDLQEAYDEGFLTVDDLETIANYLNNYIPYPDALSQSVAKKIKRAYAEKLKTDVEMPMPDADVRDVSIYNYYGTYNDSVTVILTYGCRPDVYIPATVTIEGVTFNFSYPYIISIWRESNESYGIVAKQAF